MTRVFRDQCRDAQRRRGMLGLLALWPRSFFDLLRAGVAERIRLGQRRGAAKRRVPKRPRRPGLLADAISDLRYAARSWRARPGFTAAVLATLTLGIGANSAIFAVVNSVVLQPLPFANSDRLISVVRIRANGRIGDLSWTDVVTIRETAEAIEFMAGYSASRADLGAVDEPGRIEVVRVTAGFLDLLGLTPAVGRLLVGDDHGPAGRAVGVLSHGAWVRRFGADSAIIGRTITLNDRPYTIVGVLDAKTLAFPSPDVEIWVPTSENFHEGAFFLSGIGRIRAGATVTEAQTELDIIARHIAETYPEIYADREFQAHGLREAMVGDVRLTLLVLLAAVGGVLLIACANVANLLLIRATERNRELAVRSALGAARFRLIRQLLAESIGLALLGAAGGLLLAHWETSLLLSLAPPDLPRRTEVGVNLVVVLMTGGVAIAAGTAFGLAGLVRIPTAHLGDALRDHAPGSGASTHRRRMRSALAVAQLGLSCVLLVGSGLLVKSLWTLVSVDPGFRAEHLLTFRVSTPASAFPTRESVTAIHREVRTALEVLPGVSAVASANLVPFHGGNLCNNLTVPSNPNGGLACAEFRTITADYFAILGMRLASGRGFEIRDNEQPRAVAVANETLVRLASLEGDPIGQRVEMFGRPWVLIGVVSDVRQFSLDREPVPVLYVSLSASPLRYARYLVRVDRDPLALAADVRTAVWSVDTRLPLAEFSTLEHLVDSTIVEPRFRTLLLGSMAALALALSLIGVFGVVAYTVTSRSREFGIRVALGAGRSRVMREVLLPGMGLIGGGVAIGLLGAAATTRALGSFLYGIEASDLGVFVIAALVVFTAGLLACYLPARRATRVDPIQALRHD